MSEALPDHSSERMQIAAIEHVQLAMPPGMEGTAREFYQDVLGIPEVRKPSHLAKRGGAWFERGSLKIHLGVEADFRPARKAHPALLVVGLEALITRLREHNVEVIEEDPLEGYLRVYIADPFGNRIELMEPRQSGDAKEGRMATGECVCGAVQFEIDADLSGVFVCHCSICRRSTGSNGIAVVLVPNDQFRWVRGQEHVATWKKPNTNWQTWFCRVCGSPVPGENDPTRMFVPAGSITRGGDALKVIHHVWVGSKAVWDEIGDAGQQHAEGYRA